MSEEQTTESQRGGYGNIYTPHAGSMVIQVHRESGLANRTIVLSQRQVTLLRRSLKAGAVLLGIILLSWLFLAAQAARVPVLTKRVASLQRDVKRVDTLQTALVELEKRFHQVQRMLGANTPVRVQQPAKDSAPRVLRVDSVAPSVPSLWPVPVAGQILPYDSSAHSEGIDIAVPAGTAIRAAGAGTVVEIGNDAKFGKVVKIRHRDGYESVYANAGDILVEKNDQVPAGAVIALSGNGGHAPVPHVHFEIRKDGTAVDPLSLVKPGGSSGDLR